MNPNGKEDSAPLWPFRSSVAGGPLFEVGDQLLDLELHPLQRGEELRLELALELLAFLQEVLHQVAKALRQLAPRGRRFGLGGCGIAFGRQGAHGTYLLDARMESEQRERRRWAASGDTGSDGTGVHEPAAFSGSLCGVRAARSGPPPGPPPPRRAARPKGRARDP